MLKPLRVMKNDIAEGFRGRILDPVKSLHDGTTKLAVHKYAHMLASLCGSQMSTFGDYVSAPLARASIRSIGEAIFATRGPERGQGRPPVHNFPCNHNTIYKTREAFAYLGLSSYETLDKQVEMMTRHAFGFFGLHHGTEACDADPSLADIKYPVVPIDRFWQLARHEVLRVSTLGINSCHSRDYATPAWLLSRLDMIDRLHSPSSHVRTTIADALCMSENVFFAHIDELFCKDLLMVYRLPSNGLWYRLTEKGQKLLDAEDYPNTTSTADIEGRIIGREYFNRCRTVPEQELSEVDHNIKNTEPCLLTSSVTSSARSKIPLVPNIRSSGFKAFKERTALLGVLKGNISSCPPQKNSPKPSDTTCEREATAGSIKPLPGASD